MSGNDALMKVQLNTLKKLFIKNFFDHTKC